MANIETEQSSREAALQTVQEFATNALGWARSDPLKLISLDDLVSRIDLLYQSDLRIFESTAEKIYRFDLFFDELEAALASFRSKLLTDLNLTDAIAKKLQCVPIEAALFNDSKNVPAYNAFIERYATDRRFSEARGKGLFNFLIAHYMEQAESFQRLGRGLRSRIISFSGSAQSAYSLWEGISFGRVWSTGTLPRTVFAQAMYRLIDGLFDQLGFAETYRIFESKLNPLSKFPIQILHSIYLEDSISLAQEFALAKRIAVPEYNLTRVGGSDDSPLFKCELKFKKVIFEGSGGSKIEARRASASALIDYLLEKEKNDLLLLMANKLSAGIPRERRETTIRTVTTSVLESLRKCCDVSLSPDELQKCLTLKSDVLTYSLSPFDSNERLAFCGSWLATVIREEVSGHSIGSRLYLKDAAKAEIQRTHSSVYARTKDGISDRFCLDVAQAVLYSEFLRSGYDAAKHVFQNCFGAFQRSQTDSVLKEYTASTPYNALLQEHVLAQSTLLPEFQYVLVTPKKLHAPTFRCRASYGKDVAEALGPSKKAAKNLASYKLLQKLTGMSDV
jgi:dsRNA-specific ribonuclease